MRPRGRVGARTGCPRSLAVLLPTLVRYITPLVALPCGASDRKENCHPLLRKGRSGGENGRLGGLTDPGALVAERNATGNRRLGPFEIRQCSGPNFSVGMA